MNYKELVYRLIQLRLARGWSRAQLAKKMRSSKSYVWRLEIHQSQATPQMLERWCDALGVTQVYIIME